MNVWWYLILLPVMLLYVSIVIWYKSKAYTIKPITVIPLSNLTYTVIILNIGTDRSEQTVQTQIRLLLLMEQSDQGLLCLVFCLHLLNTILHCKIQLFQL